MVTIRSGDPDEPFRHETFTITTATRGEATGEARVSLDQLGENRRVLLRPDN